MTKLTHIDDEGAAHMVDVSAKDVSARTATARARVDMKPETLEMIRAGAATKGDVLAIARIAGIMAAKKTAELIPLCHPLMISTATVDFAFQPGALEVTATVKVAGRTGVEMEALTACSLACLTIYDMCKAVDRAMRITDLRLIEKAGGRSGHYAAEPAHEPAAGQ